MARKLRGLLGKGDRNWPTSLRRDTFQNFGSEARNCQPHQSVHTGLTVLVGTGKEYRKHPSLTAYHRTVQIAMHPLYTYPKITRPSTSGQHHLYLLPSNSPHPPCPLRKPIRILILLLHVVVAQKAIVYLEETYIGYYYINKIRKSKYSWLSYFGYFQIWYRSQHHCPGCLWSTLPLLWLEKR